MKCMWLYRCDDFVKITDSTGDKVFCGIERESFANKFCSNVIYVTYSASTAQTPLLKLYKGFNLYFESKENKILNISL